MKITRREFGSFAAALPLGAGVPPVAANPDVLIVGAGAAGLAAAQVLVNSGKRVQVIEAAPRIGGRCYTDTATFGVPLDLGAQWLRNAERNPLTGFAKLFGFQTVIHSHKELLFAHGSMMSPHANRAYERAFDALSLAVAEAAEEETDRAASTVALPTLDAEAQAWLGAASSQIGPLDMGVDLENMSVRDWFQRDEAEPVRLVREGLGTLVARLGSGLPISVSTRVRAIRTGARGTVTAVTDRGQVTAKAAIVTVSAGVLSAGAITFEPATEAVIQIALSGLQMGLVTKTALGFARNSPALQFPDNSILVSQSPNQHGVSFLIRPFGAPVVICLCGGSVAWSLSRGQKVEHVSFALEHLRALLGAQAERGFRFGATSDWGSNPLTLGTTAAARPGATQARDALAAPVGERVFLAGEALAGRAAQTVHGAYENGRAVARRVLVQLKRK